MAEMEMSSCRRRQSVPQISVCDDDDKDMLIDPSDVNPNIIKEPEEPIYSRARLSMDGGGMAELSRARTPEEAFRDDLKPDGAFMNLRPKSPIYIPQYQRFDSEGNSIDDDLPNTPPDVSECEIKKSNEECSESKKRSPKFKLVRSDSNSGRILVKIPLDPKLNNIEENVIFDRNADGTTNNNSDSLSPSYPICMTSYKRGVSPSGQMNLVMPDQPSLNMLRARAKIHFSRDVHQTIDLLKSKVSEVYQKKSIDEEVEEEKDLMHIMGDDGKIIWNPTEDEEDLEEVLGVTLNEMPTMKQEEFQDLDPSNIVDAYLTEDYIILETSS